MRKGTIPSLKFELPFNVSEISRARVTVRCRDPYVSVKKETESLEMKDNAVICRLTQEETFLFPCESFAEVQLAICTVKGEPLRSEVFTVFVERCIDEEVI